MNIIFRLEEARKRKRGWTYVLVSADKKRMKIGQAIPDLQRRVYQHMHCEYYKTYNFEFLLAIDDFKYELILHQLFSEYRARYKWTGKEDFGVHYTEKEVVKKARELYKLQNNEMERFVWLLRNNIQITRNEIFHLPPRKIGNKLKSIIVDHLRSSN